MIHSDKHPFLLFFRSLPDERLKEIFDSMTDGEKQILSELIAAARDPQRYEEPRQP